MRIRRAGSVVLGFLLLSLAAMPAAGQSQDDCFTVLVGRKASPDGSVMIAHNDDDRGDIIVNLRKIRPRNDGPARRVDLGRGGVWETDGRTAGFLWIEATTQEYADSFVNEHGVVITSDSCPSRETAADLTDGGIGYMLRRLLAEKATSAREAVRLAGELVERFGYRGSGRTYSIVDKNEAWMLAVIQGRHWMAQRVPDDEVAIIPNHYTIRGIRMDDPDHFMGSRDLLDYARAKGWYDEAKDGPFDFKRAFARPPAPDPARDGNILRHWRGLVRITGRDWPLDGDYPFSVKPGTAVTEGLLMDILRDHYEGTPYDETDGYKTGTPNATKFRTICTASTIYAFVASLDGSRPEPISVRMWLALGKPDTTVFLPLYYGLENLPTGAGRGPLIPDDEAFYKQHFEDAEFKAARDSFLNTRILALERIVEADYGPLVNVLKEELFPLERELVAGRRAFESEFAAAFARNRVEALNSLDRYVAAAFERLSSLTGALLAKLRKN